MMPSWRLTLRGVAHGPWVSKVASGAFGYVVLPVVNGDLPGRFTQGPQCAPIEVRPHVSTGIIGTRSAGPGRRAGMYWSWLGG
jgi:hypothetical protein